MCTKHNVCNGDACVRLNHIAVADDKEKGREKVESRFASFAPRAADGELWLAKPGKCGKVQPR